MIWIGFKLWGSSADQRQWPEKFRFFLVTKSAQKFSSLKEGMLPITSISLLFRSELKRVPWTIFISCIYRAMTVKTALSNIALKCHEYSTAPSYASEKLPNCHGSYNYDSCNCFIAKLPFKLYGCPIFLRFRVLQVVVRREASFRSRTHLVIIFKRFLTPSKQ